MATSPPYENSRSTFVELGGGVRWRRITLIRLLLILSLGEYADYANYADHANNAVYSKQLTVNRKQ